MAPLRFRCTKRPSVEQPRIERARIEGFAAVACLALGVISCSINPATGKSELSLVSESEEIAMGKQADPGIVRQFGLYPDEKVQQYVQELGASLAARSERPHLPWTFRVLDDPIVNAFALPGGYIYVTRGIMTHLDSEAELAGVLGHEIGHVTARHGASQMSKSMLAQLGMGIGMAAAPDYAALIGDLGSTGVGLLFLKYGRDDERQADTLGLRYSLAADYDPYSFVEVFEVLDRVGEQSGSDPLPTWLSTHPTPDNRTERLLGQIDDLEQSVEGMRVDRESYLARIEGMPFGDNPREGFVENNVFYHPGMAFRFEVPTRWRVRNSREVVVATDSGQKGIFRLTLAPESTRGAAAGRFYKQSGVEPTQVGPTDINDLPASSSEFEVKDAYGAVTTRGVVAFIEHGGYIFELLAYARPNDYAALTPALRTPLLSFQELKDARILRAEPGHIELVRLSRTSTLATAPELRDAVVPPETLELINGVEPGEEVEAGTLVKTVKGYRTK